MTTCSITKGGSRFLHNFGANNTFVGKNARNFTMTGSGNTGSGRDARTPTSASTTGARLGLKNTSTGGIEWSVISTGSGNGEGAGKLRFHSGSTRMTNSANGSLARTTRSSFERENRLLDTISIADQLDRYDVMTIEFDLTWNTDYNDRYVQHDCADGAGRQPLDSHFQEIDGTRRSTGGLIFIYFNRQFIGPSILYPAIDTNGAMPGD